MELDKTYWNTRYLEQNTPWDIGFVSPPIKEYVDVIQDKNLRVLIPGAGNAYESVYLHQLGFEQVFVCDWAEEALVHLQKVAPDFPASHLICKDFFELEGQFDLVLEQTFFCAIAPALRSSYVDKMSSLLVSGGTLAGLLFASHFEKPGPPFGGDAAEYESLFSSQFVINRLSVAKNSILPRANNELFFELFRK